MTVGEIYTAVLAKLGESLDLDENTDYAERVPYIMGDFYRVAKDTDDKYRRAHNIEKRSTRELVCFELEMEFPLCDVFISPAILYIASDLLRYENESISEDLNAEWILLMTGIETGLPAAVEKISERYPF